MCGFDSCRLRRATEELSFRRTLPDLTGARQPLNRKPHEFHPYSFQKHANQAMIEKSSASSFGSLTVRFVALLAAMLALTGGGCGATKPSGASFASVTIKGHTPNEIAQVTAQVFQEEGYVGGSTKGHPMVFQKEGSRMTDLAYQGVVDTHYGAGTAVRVKVDIVSLGANFHRLQCQAYVVRNAGDGFFEEEQRLANIRSGPYQSLLNKVANQLK